MIYKLYSTDNIFIKETPIFPDNFTGIMKSAIGTKYWYKNGLYHREDGAAVEYTDGHKEYWVEGKFHRLDGPACEYSDGPNYWYINGEQVTELQCKLLYSIIKLKGLL